VQGRKGGIAVGRNGTVAMLSCRECNKENEEIRKDRNTVENLIKTA
jgi:hypothetical protein